MARVFLGLGANLGDRELALRQARESLAAQVELVRCSSLYETEPVGLREQPWFLNQCYEGRTALAPEALLSFVQEIEANLGRVRQERFGPRTLDIDILFYDDLIIETPRLTIPHPRLHERAFVLVPLEEIAPDFVHPVLGLTVRELCQGLPPGPVVRPYRD